MVVDLLIRWAGGAGPLQQAEQPSAWVNLLPIALIFGIFWFLVIAPSRKRQREHQQMLSTLQKGDRVITNGGLHGTVAAVEDRVVILRIADSVKVRVEKSAVGGMAPAGPEEKS